VPASVTELSRVGLLAALPGQTLSRLAERMRREELPAGRTIVAEGDGGDRFYVLLSGLAAVTQAGRGPRSVLRPGEKPRRVASGAGPHWAPGGRTIAYLSRGGLRRKRIGTDGPGRVLRTPGGYELAWSPDGRFIVFRRSLRLRLIGSRHGHRLPIAFDAPGIDFSVDWQPRPR